MLKSSRLAISILSFSSYNFDKTFFASSTLHPSGGVCSLLRYSAATGQKYSVTPHVVEINNTAEYKQKVKELFGGKAVVCDDSSVFEM